jgi:hypothetical protein
LPLDSPCCFENFIDLTASNATPTVKGMLGIIHPPQVEDELMSHHKLIAIITMGK